MNRPVLLVTLMAALAAVALRRHAAAQRAERDLWAEAGIAPDLR